MGLTCVLTADRAVPGGRLAGGGHASGSCCPLPDRGRLRRRRHPPRARARAPAARPGPARRGRALECQLALPRAPTSPTGRPAVPARPPPLRIVELPPDPVLPLPERGDRTGPAAAASALPSAPAATRAARWSVDLLRTGGLLVAGPPGSGRSTALDAFAAAPAAPPGPRCCASVAGHPASRRRRAPTPTGCDPRDDAGRRDAGWRRWRGRPGVVVADDVGTPAEWPALAGATGGSAPRSRCGARRRGEPPAELVGALPGAGRGAAPQPHRAAALPGPGDADLLGVRLPRMPLPVRPGCGLAGHGGGLERVQVARRVGRAAAPPERPAQSSSSAGPISCVAYQASS